MTGFLVRMLVCALGLALAAALVPGIRIGGAGTLLIAALLLGFANAVIRPIVILLTLPITIVTLGLFLLVINAAMLALVAALLPGMTVGGFFSALAGAVIVGLTGWIASWTIGPKGRWEVLVVRRRD